MDELDRIGEVHEPTPQEQAPSAAESTLNASAEQAGTAEESSPAAEPTQAVLDSQEPRSKSRRSGAAGYVATAVVSALIGAGVVAAALPTYVIPQVKQELRAAGLNPGGGTMRTSGGGLAMPMPASGNDLPTSQVSLVAQQVGPAVVGVINRSYSTGFFGNQQMSEGHGSGVIFDSRGYIVTNYHVIDGSSELKVTLADGRTVDAKVVGSDPATDLAVLKVDAGSLPTAAFGDSDRVRVGDLAVAIGDPLGQEFQRTVTAGIVSGLGRNVETEDGPGIYRDLIQTDATINPGNSGGALVNATGEVVGINTIKVPAGLQGAEGMGFAIPSNQVRQVVDDLVKYGQVVNRAYLGVGTLSPQQALQQGIRLQDGALVAYVKPGSPADKAGLQRGDVIRKMDGAEIHGSKDVAAQVMKHKPGDRISIEVQREESSRTVEAVLAQLPQETQ